MKSSQEKNFKKKLLEHVPEISKVLEEIWPKKANITFGKLKSFQIVYYLDNVPTFVDVEGFIVPHFTILLKCRKVIRSFPFT